MAEKRTPSPFGVALVESLREAVAWKRGERALETVNIDPMPAERVRAIRRRVATSARDFELRYGIPAATLNNWEQGRRHPDPAARLLLMVMEQEPDAIERALGRGAAAQGVGRQRRTRPRTAAPDKWTKSRARLAR
ncbi:MAG TPA: transcriptional regulator [Acetobacteraceae bacterium]|nr:transcriptional regulator [Acetobacteraceae bacterium]